MTVPKITVMAKNADVRKENIRAVRKCFCTGGPYSLSQISRMTGLSHGAAVSVIHGLLESGEIILSEKTGNTVGRKTHKYRLNETYMHLLKLYVHRRGQAIAVRSDFTDLYGNILETDITEKGDRDLTLIADSAERMMKKHPETDMILVSSPGVCVDGVISNFMPEPYDAGAVLSERCRIPYVLENDVNTACIGFSTEYPQYRDIALIYQADTAVFGCGLIINHELYSGAAHAAGELRWFPFMRYIENRTAAGLLKEQVLSVAALLNPEVIGWCSDATDAQISLTDDLPGGLIPDIIHIRDLYGMQSAGLHAIAMKSFVNA